MKTKLKATTPYDLQKPHGLRQSIAGLTVEMAAVCGVAAQRSAASTPQPLSQLYMGLQTDLARPLSRFEAMLQASGASARRLNFD